MIFGTGKEKVKNMPKIIHFQGIGTIGGIQFFGLGDDGELYVRYGKEEKKWKLLNEVEEIIQKEAKEKLTPFPKIQ